MKSVMKLLLLLAFILPVTIFAEKPSVGEVDCKKPVGDSAKKTCKECGYVYYYTTPTKLPRKLIEKFVLYSSVEGDLVLDPFMGSGQTAIVARDVGRIFLGFEKSEEIYKFAIKRFEELCYFVNV